MGGKTPKNLGPQRPQLKKAQNTERTVGGGFWSLLLRVPPFGWASYLRRQVPLIVASILEEKRNNQLQQLSPKDLECSLTISVDAIKQQIWPERLNRKHAHCSCNCQPHSAFSYIFSGLSVLGHAHMHAHRQTKQLSTCTHTYIYKRIDKLIDA